MKVTKVEQAELVYFADGTRRMSSDLGNGEYQAAYQRYKARDVKRKAIRDILIPGTIGCDSLADAILDKLDAIDRGEG